MDVSEKSKLKKLLGMLGSAFDGERANAARMIQAMAEKKSLTIVELIYASGRQKTTRPQKADRKPSPEDSSWPPDWSPDQLNKVLPALQEIAASRREDPEFVLTEWEYQFASDVAKRYSCDYELSVKQMQVAQKIIQKVESARAAP